MPWDFFWTAIWQVVLACLILTLPLSLIAFFLSSAITSGALKRPSKTGEPTEGSTS